MPLPPYKSAPYVKLRKPNPKHVQNEAERDALFGKTTIKNWLKNISKDSWYKSVNVVHRFLLYRRRQRLESDPDKVIRQIKEGTNQVREDHLQALLDWLQDPGEEMKYVEPNSKWAYYKTVKSFYRHNRCDLPWETPQFKSQSEEVEVEQKQTAEEYLKAAKKVLDSGKLSPRDRSIILTKVQGFMDGKTLATVFNYVAFPQIAKHFGTENFRLWDESRCPVKVVLVRTKTGYQHYTFLDRDAIAAMKDWLAVREQQFGPIKVRQSNPKYLPRSDPIYTIRYNEMRPIRPSYVSALFNRTGKRAGVNIEPKDDLPKDKRQKRRYPFRGHEVRDTAITLARSAGVPREVAEFFAGHNIDRLGYDRSPDNDPDHFQMMYSKLARHLNIVSGEVEEVRAEYEKKVSDQLAERDTRIKELEEKQQKIAEWIAKYGNAKNLGELVDKLVPEESE